MPKYFIPTHYDNFFVPFDQFRNFDFEISRTGSDNSELKEFIQTFCAQDIQSPVPEIADDQDVLLLLAGEVAVGTLLLFAGRYCNNKMMSRTTTAIVIVTAFSFLMVFAGQAPKSEAVCDSTGKIANLDFTLKDIRHCSRRKHLFPAHRLHIPGRNRKQDQAITIAAVREAQAHSAQPKEAKRKRDSAQPKVAKRKRDSAQPTVEIMMPAQLMTIISHGSGKNSIVRTLDAANCRGSTAESRKFAVRDCYHSGYGSDYRIDLNQHRNDGPWISCSRGSRSASG